MNFAGTCWHYVVLVAAIVAIIAVSAVVNVALLRRERRQSGGDPGVILGWARVSLLGREEHVGMVKACDGGQSYEVATIAGRAFRTAPGAVYKIECVSFDVLERAIIEADEHNEAEKQRRQEWAEEQHANEQRTQKRIGDLRAAMQRALDEGPEPETQEEWRMTLALALENDDTATDEAIEQHFPF